MISIDTNLFLYAQNLDCPEHQSAYNFILEYGNRDDVIICELVLVELYILLRNPAVLKTPLSPKEAVTICQTYRHNPNWRIVENAPVMETVWSKADQTNFPRRRIFDLRFALTLHHHGVTQLATANVKDFQDIGFQKIWNPTQPSHPD